MFAILYLRTYLTIAEKMGYEKVRYGALLVFFFLAKSPKHNYKKIMLKIIVSAKVFYLRKLSGF